MSDQNNQKIEGDELGTNDQSLNQTPSNALENTGAPSSEPASPVETSASISTPLSVKQNGSSTNSLTREENDALARAFSKINDARLEPLNTPPPGSPVISPVISAVNTPEQAGVKKESPMAISATSTGETARLTEAEPTQGKEPPSAEAPMIEEALIDTRSESTTGAAPINSPKLVPAILPAIPSQSTFNPNVSPESIPASEFEFDLPELAAEESAAPEPVSQLEAPIHGTSDSQLNPYSHHSVSDSEFDQTPTSSQPTVAPYMVSASSSDTKDSGVKRQSYIGQVLFNRYAVLDRIGEGSTCQTYSAMKLDSETLVVIKTPKLQTDAVVKQRFTKAVIKHGELKHPNIVKSIAYLESPDGQPFFAMEHLAGVTLEEILTTVEKVDDEETLALILIQIASALEYAHKLKITHSRLTPRDVLVLESGEQLDVKVMGFQIASIGPLDSTSEKDFSNLYLSPEALNGEESPQADIYSLGVIAYRMATGQFPFKGASESPNSKRVANPLSKYTPDLKCVNKLNQAVQDALETDPKWRTESATQFKALVSEWIEATRNEMTGVHTNLSERIPADSDTAPQAISFEQNEFRDSIDTPANDEPTNEEVIAAVKYSRKRVRHIVKTTIHNLVALKKKQQVSEQTAGRKFADTLAATGPRRSPLSSMVRLVSVLVICGGTFVVSAIIIFTNFDSVQSAFGQASRGLSELIPGRKRQEFEIGEKIMLENPKPVDIKNRGNKEPKRTPPTEIFATPPPFAVPESQRSSSGSGTSFGVNNSSDNTGNLRRIEYRDYVPPK